MAPMPWFTAIALQVAIRAHLQHMLLRASTGSNPDSIVLMGGTRHSNRERLQERGGRQGNGTSVSSGSLRGGHSEVDLCILDRCHTAWHRSVALLHRGDDLRGHFDRAGGASGVRAVQVLSSRSSGERCEVSLPHYRFISE